MNYIALLNRFWQLHRQQGFAPGDTHLYGCLLNAFSDRGTKSHWPESIQWTDGTLASIAGTNVKTVDAARKRLAERGLIQVVSFGKGNRSGQVYRLAPEDQLFVATSPVTSSKNGDVAEEVSAQTSVKKGEVRGEVYQATSPKNGEVKRRTPPVTSPKNGEDRGEVSPVTSPKKGEVTPTSSPKNGEVNTSPLPQPLQQLTRKTERSHIYMEFQTLNTKLTKQQQSAAEAAVAGDGAGVVASGAEKKRGQAAQVPAAAVSSVAEEAVEVETAAPPISIDAVRALLLASSPHQRYALEQLKLVESLEGYRALVELFITQQQAMARDPEQPFTQAGPVRRHFMNWLGRRAEFAKTPKNSPYATHRQSPTAGQCRTEPGPATPTHYEFDLDRELARRATGDAGGQSVDEADFQVME